MKSDIGPARGRVIIRQYRNIIRVAGPNGAPLDQELYDALLPRLEYLHKRTLHGREAIDPNTGERRYVEITRKCLYMWQDGCLHCPRGFVDFIERRSTKLGYSVKHVTMDEPRKRPDAYEPRKEVFNQFELREGQREFFRAVMSRIAKGRGGIVKAVPAFGKSFCVKVLAKLYPKARILVVVPGLALLKQLGDDISRALPSVGIMGGGMKTSGRVVIATAGSMGSAGDDWDIVVADEFHEFASTVRSNHFARLSALAIVIGMTATPEGRLDGSQRRLEGMAGPIIYEFNWDQARALDRVADIYVRWHDVRLLDNPAEDLTGNIRKQQGIWRNAERNAIIAASLEEAVRERQHTLVLASTVEHVLFLQKAILDAGMPEFAVSYSLQDYKRFDKLSRLEALKDMEFGPIDPVDLATTREDFKNGEIRHMISTGTLGTGFSADSLDVVVRTEALGGSAIGDEQKGGRVCRTHDGKDKGRVYDYLDQFDRGFNRAALDRRAIYRGLGWNEEPHPYLDAIDRAREGRHRRG